MMNFWTFRPNSEPRCQVGRPASDFRIRYIFWSRFHVNHEKGKAKEEREKWCYPPPTTTTAAANPAKSLPSNAEGSSFPSSSSSSSSSPTSSGKSDKSGKRESEREPSSPTRGPKHIPPHFFLVISLLLRHNQSQCMSVRPSVNWPVRNAFLSDQN